MSYPQGPQYGGYPQQQSGYPQQPPSGAFPQQGYPQGYPQQPGGYPQPPYPPGPPRRNNNGLVIALAAVAAAAIIGLVVVLIVSGSDDDDSSNSAGDKPPAGAPEVTIPGPNGSKPTGSSGGSGNGTGSSSARALSEAAVTIMESRDFDEIDRLACSSTSASDLKKDLTRLPSGASVSLDDVQESGSTAQATITVTVSGRPQKITMEMRKSGSKWCASGI